MADEQSPAPDPADASPPVDAAPATASAAADTQPTAATDPQVGSTESVAPMIDPTGLEPDDAAIEAMLRQASFEDAGAVAGGAGGAATVATSSYELPNFSQVMQDAQASSIELLRDVELNVKIELGRSRMLVEDVLKLTEGSVVELDKLAGDPVDVFVNERLVARGEVLVLNDNFCVRVNEIIAGAKDEGF